MRSPWPIWMAPTNAPLGRCKPFRPKAVFRRPCSRVGKTCTGQESLGARSLTTGDLLSRHPSATPLAPSMRSRRRTSRCRTAAQACPQAALKSELCCPSSNLHCWRAAVAVHPDSPRLSVRSLSAGHAHADTLRCQWTESLWSMRFRACASSSASGQMVVFLDVLCQLEYDCLLAHTASAFSPASRGHPRWIPSDLDPQGPQSVEEIPHRSRRSQTVKSSQRSRNCRSRAWRRSRA